MRTETCGAACSRLLVGALVAAGAAAQCATNWIGSLPSAASPVSCVGALPSGDIVVGGWFTTIGGVPANWIARWDGTTFHALGSGTASFVSDLAVLANGDVIVAGAFPSPVRWNGFAWSPVGASFTGASRVAIAPSGDIWVSGGFPGRVARWNGVSWSILGSSLSTDVHAMCVDETGAAFVCTESQLVVPPGLIFPGNVYRWNGAGWNDLGTVGALGAVGSVAAIAPRRGGGCHLAGSFQQVGGVAAVNVATWNGNWLPAGAGVPGGAGAVIALPDGSVVANATNSSLWRFTGSAWSLFAPTLGGTSMDLALAPNGELLAAGYLSSPAGGPSHQVARLASNCPATSLANGTPCLGSAGAMVLTAETLPWTGATCRTRCTGFAATSLGVAVLGFAATTVPLVQIHPAGLPGCDLRATPDFVATLLPVAGAAAYAVAIPLAPALVGGVFHEQIVQLELAGLQITSIVGSNALALTIGQF